MTLFYAVILLGGLIFVHELGHFIFAKWSGVKVLKFSLGFGPKLLGKTYGETEYLISAFPLGGYVKMLGEDPDDPYEEVEKDRTFREQPLYKRAVIVLAGPIFNLIFAVLVFAVVYLSGVPRLIAVVGEVMEDTPAFRAELKEGDMVIAIDDQEVKYWDEMTEIIHKSPETPVTLKIQRGQSIMRVQITPERKVMKDILGDEKEYGVIGVKPLIAGKDAMQYEVVSYSLPEAVSMAGMKTWTLISLTFKAIGKMIVGDIPAKTIGGPILIVQMAGQQASEGINHFLVFMALISINLGILNLLPIPVLDGGHLLFMGIEAIIGKPIDEKTFVIFQKIGLFILISLMAFAFYNDILRLITGNPLQ